MILCFHVALLFVWVCLFWPAALVCSSLSALRWIFASKYGFLLCCKATVSGTALTCLCARPTASGTVGPLQTAAPVPPKTTERRPIGRRRGRQTPNITSTDTGRLPRRNHEGKAGIFLLNLGTSGLDVTNITIENRVYFCLMEFNLLFTGKAQGNEVYWTK